jgi:hypothetical protein
MEITRVFGRTLVGVVFKRIPGKKKYMVTDRIIVLKADTKFIKIDSNLVADTDGNQIPPTEGYWRTASTIDPYHVIVDMF